MTRAGSVTRTIGFALFVAGLPALAIALGWLFVAAETFPFPLWTMGCGGAALVLAGLALLLPETLAAPRGLLAASSISAIAAVFDWIAFGRLQGGWRFMLEALMNTLALRQNAAHNVVVLFAVLLTLLALAAWAQWLRGLTARDGTPLKRPSRKSTAKDAIDSPP